METYCTSVLRPPHEHTLATVPPFDWLLRRDSHMPAFLGSDVLGVYSWVICYL